MQQTSEKSKPIYSTREIGGETFMLAEKLDSYVESQAAAAEYRAERLYVRVELCNAEACYYIWTRPAPYRRLPRLLAGEVVRRSAASAQGVRWHLRRMS